MGLLWDIVDRALCIAVTTTALWTGHVGRCQGEPTVRLDQGLVHGFEENSTYVFLGVPFAETTGGDNRWKAPQGVSASVTREIDATRYGPSCAQAMSGDAIVAQSEDCLNLNVWTPTSGTDLPVFVYIYGGAMVTGGNSNAQWQGYNFARKDVIYVNINYRESIFASPASLELEGLSESQNFGILDVELALDWVMDNIHAFGGDKNRIVIAGHSSGGVHVDHYLWNHPDTTVAGAMELSANAKSGPAYAPHGEALSQVAEDVQASGVTLGCDASNPTLDCLRKVDTYALQTSNFNSTTNTWFSPVVDNITRYSDYEGRYAQGKFPTSVPLLVGNSDREGALFANVYSFENTNFSYWINTFDADIAYVPDDVLLDAYNEADYSSISEMSGASYGDARFFCPTDYMIDLRASSQPVWVYRWFGQYDNILGTGLAASHGSEIPFFHGGNECFSKISGVSDAEQALADNMNDWLVAWVKNPSAGPGWDRASAENGPLAKIGVPGKELEIEMGETGEFNGRCQSVYKEYIPGYPVVQSPE